MAVVKLRKGYDLCLLGGVPDNSITPVECRMYAVVPDDFQGLVPRLDVKEGDTVKKGDRLCHDRQFAEIVITSPVSGVVKEIKRGERRKIEAIIIEKNEEGSARVFDVKGDAKSILLESGLWACMTQRPYAVVPNPNVVPRDVFVTAFDSAPLAPDLMLEIKGKAKYVQRGIDVLASLTEGKVYVGVRCGSGIAVKNAVVTEFSGPHPAGNAGVQLANIKPVNKGETVWTLDIVTVARIGELFTEGTVPYDTIVAVSGPRANCPRYVRCEMGASLTSILNANEIQSENKRIINGNVLSGVIATSEDFLRFPYRHITIIDELDNPGEFMGWASLSPRKFSVYRSFFSWLCPRKPVNLDAKLNGGERAIVMSGEYDKMLPMDIYAEFLVKSVIAFDIEKM